MGKKQMIWKTKGMNRDLSVSAFNPEFAFENRNLRLGTNDANTMMSWVNEKGTLAIGLRNVEYWSKYDPNADYTRIVYKDPDDPSYTYHAANTEDTTIIGTPIGTAVINHKLVVFTTDTLHDHDYIYVLNYIDSTKTSMYCKMLFGGENLSLNFKVEKPLETLVSYESEMVQKVYWTDGINQPRVINIEGNIRKNNNTQFDFVPTLQLQEDVKIEKILGGNGMFAPGVIQYAFTYYNKYRQESNIFYASPLLYVSYRDRGGSPEDKVENAFKITVDNVDNNFDYLRIYSIQRTSIDGTPICKRIQDVSLEGLTKVSYTDTGTNGDNVDPVELLYKGGETISAYTLEQKDNTLFLGNIDVTRPQILEDLRNPDTGIKSRITITQSSRQIQATSVSTGSYVYANQLSATSVGGEKTGNTVPCAGFKRGDYYRLGVQFQYKTGKWSDPVWVGDHKVDTKPKLSNDNTVITLPTLTGTISSQDVAALVAEEYVKARALVVFPKALDRTVICQGVVNPTLYTQDHRNNNDLYAQSSWFFRASNGGRINTNCSVSPASPAQGAVLPYTHRGIATGIPSGCHKYDPTQIRMVEIEGDYEEINQFKIDRETVTMHSPDLEFDDQLSLMNYSDTKYRQVGYAQFTGTMSDIDLQTETSTASNLGSGFAHKSFSMENTYGIVSGLFYDDFVLDDDSNADGKPILPYENEKSSCKWLVYLWNTSGALNNDINRPANLGVQTATLKKKVISNLRYANTTFWDNITDIGYNYDSNNFPQLFTGEEVSILKLGDKLYKGNIDTMITPDNADGKYFAFGSRNGIYGVKDMNTLFTCSNWYKTFSKDQTTAESAGMYEYNTTRGWEIADSNIGDTYLDLVIKKNAVRMKYKSTPHLVFRQVSGVSWDYAYDSLPVVEIFQKTSEETRFGGITLDAFGENVWLPAGEPVSLTAPDNNGNISLSWDYGDTYFQRWDCLKTYAFTREDPNQVIEIGSFMLETRVNIDGRYDRNRGQMNNLNMSPVNFNLLNPVYTQTNNFFQYRIQDDDYYKNINYPNQVTWSKTKTSGADVDAWTNMTLASTLELDGDKGDVTSLQRNDNQLICFQETGVSRLLYNENFMISTQEGVPVEIANTGKVEGKVYTSNTVGCANKWSIVPTQIGLYFMDSNEKEIYLLGNQGSQLLNVSTAKGFSSWSKRYIPSNEVNWTPTFPEVNEKSAFKAVYDKVNQEVLFISHGLCLAYSEKFGGFTSFYDYNSTPFFNNLDDTGIWLRANQLWKHQAGDYCRFFGAKRPYSMVLVGNPDPQIDKIFTNVEFRACVDGDGDLSGTTFAPYLPFDSLDTWNEYQHGIAYLNNMRGHSAMQHHTKDNEASLKRKFRIWRCDIPRDNGDNLDTFDETFDETFHPLARAQKHPLDRMRNPWLYLRLRKDADENGGSTKRVEIHDIMMTYFL